MPPTASGSTCSRPGLIDTPMAARAVNDPRIRALPRGQAADGRRAGLGRRTSPRPHFISASRPRGLSPAPSWSSTAAGAYRKGQRTGEARSIRARPASDERSHRRSRPVPGGRPRLRSTPSRRRNCPRFARRPRISRRRSSGAGWSTSSAPAIRAWPSRRCFRATVRFPGFHPDRRAVDDLSQRGRRSQRSAPGDVSGKRAGFRRRSSGATSRPRPTTRCWPSRPAAAMP